MFNKAFIGASAFLVSTAQSSYVLGKCPRIKSDWQASHPNEKLDLTKLQGSWGAVWENYVRQLHSECVNIKLKAVEGESKKLQHVSGISFKSDDQVLYDDSLILNFNHPSDSSQAAIQSTEELHGEITDADAVSKIQSLNLPKLTNEQRETLDVNDIDIYERKREELQLIQDLISDNIKKGNRYAYPLMVLDTDYENFLVTYQCREEFRKPKDTDYMLVDGEKYREVIEEYNAEKHDQFIAERLVAHHEDDSTFQKLQQRLLEDNEKAELTDADYNKEIDDLIELDAFHRNHFKDHRPTIEQWKKRRTLYTESHSYEDYEDHFNLEKDQWFNDLRISVYFRNPQSNSDDSLEEIKSKLKTKIPGYDFDSFQMNTLHDDTLCLDGDIFSHSKAWRYSEIDKVERKNKHTEKDLIEGKIRKGEDEENIELDDNVDSHEGDEHEENENESLNGGEDDDNFSGEGDNDGEEGEEENNFEDDALNDNEENDAANEEDYNAEEDQEDGGEQKVDL